MNHLNRRLIILTAVIAMLLGLLQPSQAQWVQTNAPCIGTIRKLCVSGSSIFAGTDKGIYRSTDNGSSWTAVNSGIRDPGSGINSFAVSGSTIFVGTPYGLFSSDNNGDAWTTMTSSFYIPITSIAVCGTTIFVVYNNRSLSYSVDEGKNWVAIDFGIYDFSIYTLTVSGNDIFAGTNHGVYRSTNGGMSWTAANTGISDVGVSSCIINGGYLFVGTKKGVFRSADNGASWTAVNSGLTDWAAVNSYPWEFSVSSFTAYGNNLFVGTKFSSIFRSTDNGDHWTVVNNGLYDWYINSLAVLGTDIFVGTSSGVLHSTNNGDNWTAVNSGIYPVNSIVANDSSIIALSYFGVFLSSNKGIDWTNINSGIGNKKLISVAWSGNDIFLLTTDGVFQTVNKGLNWSAVNTGAPDSTYFYSMAVSGNNILVGTYSNGVFLSTNKGVSWRNIDSGFPKIFGPKVAISGNSILAYTRVDGIFQFTDNGWNSIGLIGKSINSIFMSGNTVIACTDDGTCQYSDTGWTSISFGLKYISALAVKDKKIFAASRYYGVFQLMDTTWIAVNPGLLDKIVYSLAIDDDNYIYAGTSSGVWRCPIAEITKTKDVLKPQTSNQTTLKIHAPGASSTMLSIEYSLKSPQRVHFTICDLSGRIIQTRAEEFSGSGTRRLLFDNRSLAPGCYNLQMRTETITENRLFTISR